MRSARVHSVHLCQHVVELLTAEALVEDAVDQRGEGLRTPALHGALGALHDLG
jgi:hypothetical protein